MMKPPIILARQEKRSDPTALLPSPGAVSIMQRESSGSHITNSPPIPSGIFGHGGGDSLPPSSSATHPQSVPQVLKARDEGKGRNQRRQDSASSGPSNYTPLQPGVRGGARGGETGGGHSRIAADHSVFLSQMSEMNHSVKLIDRSLHWDDKGTDVSGVRAAGRRLLKRPLTHQVRDQRGRPSWSVSTFAFSKINM